MNNIHIHCFAHPYIKMMVKKRRKQETQRQFNKTIALSKGIWIFRKGGGLCEMPNESCNYKNEI